MGAARYYAIVMPLGGIIYALAMLATRSTEVFTIGGLLFGLLTIPGMILRR